MKDIPENGVILYQTEDGKNVVRLYSRDGKVWLNQGQIAELFATSKQLISHHIINILKEGELSKISVVKDYLTTGNDGKTYQVSYFSLEMILAIGYRIRGVRGTQFRQWATQHLAEYLVKGFTMDDERLKNPDGRPDYFDELLARIRDIRASEKRFYQKVRDLFSLSRDYDSSDAITLLFFAETQNKLLYAVTGKTAAELVVARVDATKPNMGLTNWKGGIVRRADIFIAKNYLSQDELDQLNRLVVIFLDTAELRAKDRKDLTLGFWRENVDRILALADRKVLIGTGSVSKADMERLAGAAYDVFDVDRKALEARAADAADLDELRRLEAEAKNRPGKDGK